jgi:CPA1 family monovalent cation:H+ antiporter
MLAAVVSSVGIGLAAGWLASRLLALVDEHPIELTISIAAAYGTYLLADGLEQSGIIATVVAGLVIGTYGREHGLSPRALEALDVVWELIGFLLTAFAFLLVGFAISPADLVAGAGSIAWAVVAVLVARFVAVYGLVGGLAALIGERAHWPKPPVGWLHVLFWAGLRGAVAVAMALSLPEDFPERALLQQITFGVVLFTLFVQGTTAELVVGRTRAGAEVVPAA